MIVVLPGSAQVVGGHKRVGRLALALWAGPWVLLLALGALAWLRRIEAVAVLTYRPTLRGVQFARCTRVRAHPPKGRPRSLPPRPR